MAKITFIGAGSTVFAKNLLGDILSFPELSNATIALYDIDEERLKTTEKVARRIANALNAHPNIETHRDRRAALDGADYALSLIHISEPHETRHDLVCRLLLVKIKVKHVD